MTTQRSLPQPTLEESQEAFLEGDEIFAGGTVRSALAHREFRLMWLGTFGSNVGTWMQNVTLGAFAYDLTKSPTFVGLLIFAQLGPQLLLSVLGGFLADLVDRRRFLIVLQLEQLVFSLVLALLARSDHPSQLALFLAVFAVGVGAALNAPAWSAVLPALVGPRDLPGAISLNSTQLNGSRVIGPAIGGIMYATLGASAVFAFNALTYLFVVLALLAVRLPPVAGADDGHSMRRRLLAGFRVARSDPLVGRILLFLPLFSFLSLPFIGQFPVIAAQNLGMRPKSLAYGLLYAVFGAGACLGALSIGTVLARVDKLRLARLGIVGFAVCLAGFGMLPAAGPEYGAAFVLGLTYFATTTSLLTVLQSNLEDHVRGRVMALWLMGFGGVVPLGNLAAGPVIAAIGATPVVLAGAVVALVLAWWCDLEAAAKRRGAIAPRA